MMFKRKNAKVTLELSLMVGIIVVAVLAALVMFGNGLKDVVANGGFTKSAVNQEMVANKTESVNYGSSQELVAVTGVQGLISNLKRMNTGLNLIGTNKNELSEIQLQEIYKSLLAASMTSSQTMDNLPEDIQSEMIGKDVYKNRLKEASNLYDIKVVFDNNLSVANVESRQQNVLASAPFVQNDKTGVQYINAVMKSVYGY